MTQFIDKTNYCKSTLIEGYLLTDKLVAANLDKTLLTEFYSRLALSQKLGVFSLELDQITDNYCLLLDGKFFDVSTQCKGVLR
jgi:hypothetical protein